MVEQYIKDNNIQIIGISGQAGAGKDFVAEKVFKELGYKNINLAWHMKIECMAKGLGDWEDVFINKPKRVRRLLQVLGTEQGRDMWGEDIWVDAVFAWIRLFHEHWGEDKFVIADVRFENEMEAIQRVGGKVYRIVSDRARELTKASSEHPSETSLPDTHKAYNGYIHNGSNQSVQMLRDKVSVLLGER